MHIVLSNSTSLPIYEQIKEQIKAQILSGELAEGEKLPSLRRLAADLKISVLTTTRAYSELEAEGYITSQQGRVFFVMSSSSQLLREQLLKNVEAQLQGAIDVAEKAGMSREELLALLKLLMEVEE